METDIKTTTSKIEGRARQLELLRALKEHAGAMDITMEMSFIRNVQDGWFVSSGIHKRVITIKLNDI